MKSFILRYWPHVCLGAILLLGITLRVLPLNTRDFWYDEAFTGILIRLPWSEMMDSIARDVHPPLYYVVLKLWSFVWGSGPAALRMFSVSCGVLTIAAAAALLRTWHKNTWLPSLAVAFVFAIDPFFVNYSQEARMYAFLGLLLVLTTLLLRRTQEARTPGSRFCLGLSLLALCLTHYLGALFALGFVIIDFVQSRFWSLSPLKLAVWLVSAYLIPLVGGFLWLPFFLEQYSSEEPVLGWVLPVPFSALATSIHIFLFGAPVSVSGIPPALEYRFGLFQVPHMAFVLTVAIAALVIWLILEKRWTKSLTILSFMTAFPLCAVWCIQFLEQYLYVERFLIGAGIFLILFLVTALYRVHYRVLATCVILYSLLVVLIQPWSHETPFTRVDAFLDSHYPDAALIYTRAFDFSIGRYYAGEARDVKWYHEDAPGEIWTGWALIPADRQISELPSHPYVVITQQPKRYTGYKTVAIIDPFFILAPM